MAFWRLTGGVDQFTGAAGEDNVFLIEQDALGPNDLIVGGSTGVFNDALVAIDAEVLTAAKFADVSNIELLVLLGTSASTVQLTNNLVANSSRGIFAVQSTVGSDSVDASGVTNAMRIAFYAGAGNDTLTGGNGNDYFEFSVADLTSADQVLGGIGFDCLAISTGGAVSAASLANVSGIEDVLLSNSGNSITLSNAFVAGSDNGVMVIQDGSGDDTVDAGGVTNGTRVAFYAGSGSEIFISGNGSDYLSIAADQLTTADHVTGGANRDILEFSTAGSVSASAFTNVSGIDLLILNSGGNAVVLTDGVVTSADNGILIVIDSRAGNDTVNASAVVANRVVFQSTGGNDGFVGGGGSDVALFDATGLTAGDSFAGGTGFDTLQLTSAGTVAAAALANVSGVDQLFLTLGGNSIALSGGLVASSDNGVFVVTDQAGHNIVDAGAATLGGRVVFNAVAGDNNTYTGGTGSDVFLFADVNLNNTDTLTGGNGGGTDFLQVMTAASVTAADLANVNQIEVIQLLAGGSIAFTDTLSNTSGLEADGTIAADTLDGSAVSSYDIVFKGNGGADTLIGGAANDQFFLPNTDFVAIEGNGGFDKIVLTSAFNGQTFDLMAQVSKITDIEAITLEAALGAIIALGPDDVLQINSTGHSLYIVGGSDDQVDLDGTGWDIVGTNDTNANLPGHTFTHLHNLNGADLFVDELISFPIALAQDVLLA